MPGHYSFPFAFPLGGNLPATYIIDDNNYIKWSITAQLPPVGKSDQQAFKKIIHVRETCRANLGNLMGSTLSESKCCSCCCSCGSTQLSMQANVSYLTTSQSFMVDGSLDASRSKAEISNYKVVLNEKITRYAGSVKLESRSIPLFNAKKSLNPGENDSFTAEIVIPPLTGFSVHGSILSRIYFLTLEAEVCCCYSNPKLAINGILIDLTFQAKNEQEIAPPEGWNPIVAQPVMLAAFRPYVFRPETVMSLFNQRGKVADYQQEMKNKMMEENGVPSSRNLN